MSSNLKMLIMKVLTHTPTTGYGMVKQIEEKTGWKPSYGSVYPLLEDMKEQGLVEVEEKGRKKTYTLTEKGKEKAEELDEEKEELFKSMQENLKVVSEIMDQDMSVIVRLLGEFKEGRDPLAQVSPEIFDFRNRLIQMCIEGLEEEETEEIKALLKENIRKLKEIR